MSSCCMAGTGYHHTTSHSQLHPLDPGRDAPSSFTIFVAPSMKEGGIMFTEKKIWFKEFHPLPQSKFQSKKDEGEDEKQQIDIGILAKA